MKRIFLLMTALALVALVAACASATPAPTGATGVRVETGGGAYRNISVHELKTMLEHKDFSFINTHIPYAGEIEPTDGFVPYDALDENLGKLPSDKNAKIVLYCQSDRMSTIAANELVKKGYTNLYNVVGGMVAWEGAGFPLLRKQ
jgi:rhodanese-related sulfurtransferase